MSRLIAAVAIALIPAVASAENAPAVKATAQLLTPEEMDAGTVTLLQTSAGALLTAKLKNLPEGIHAFHIHAVGTCEPPEFASAQGHFNPTGAKHGFLSGDGPHAGDMPNIHVISDSGALEIEVLNPRVSLEEDEATLFDDDGAAIVIHQGADDYESDPAGAAGPRIACGVIERD